MDFDFGVNQGLVEELYYRFKQNPSSVDEAWRRFFESHEAAGRAPSWRPPAAAPVHGNGNGNGDSATSPRFFSPLPPTAEFAPLAAPRVPRTRSAPPMIVANEPQSRVAALINAYRVRGHVHANLDPLGLLRPESNELALEHFGLGDVDPETVFATGDLAGPTTATLGEIVARVQATYCRSIGAEFTHIESYEARSWLQEQMESTLNHRDLSHEEQLQVLARLSDAEIFERFIEVNFKGKKRFSLEGGESFLPLLDLVIEGAGAVGVEELVMGMAHRGRLNALVNVLGMNPAELFAIFEDKDDPKKLMGRGDVKYHLGFSGDRTTRSGQRVHLTLTFNPSHLEFVNPVVEGRVRAKQDRRGDREGRRVMPVLIHGDAAFIGQGIVPETLNLAYLDGYRTGGTVHIVINNQVGFTTNPNEGRSSRYATDIVRMLRCPVFHVNGEDPEAVAQVARLAVEYRQRFQQDVVIDLYCYRKHGHNEADEPRFTQPKMYAAIDAKPSVRDVYVKHLIGTGKITEADAKRVADDRKASLEAALSQVKSKGVTVRVDAMDGVWKGFSNGPDRGIPDVATAVSREEMLRLVDALTTYPEGFGIHPKIRDLITRQFATVRAGEPIPWATAETLAYASLVREGTPIRISGQDVRRGTFTHRHAFVFDMNTGAEYSPVGALAKPPARFDVINSALSEAGVLGFDYGYSLDYPDALVIWEAQFGDFANGAQVIIDQFITSGEDKWQRMSGLTMFLPHGFEGQGPEHSSARLERFLALAAEDNIQVCNLTTSAQLFHVLRRQVHRKVRRPLVMMTPKSGLRLATSTIDEFTSGQFHRILGDATADPKKVKRVLLCSGKVYRDLDGARAEQMRDDVAIVRIEQLYPLRSEDVQAALAPYAKGTELVWVQEEPRNMGAWYFLRANLPEMLGDRPALRCVSRDESASPATGSEHAHKYEQAKLVEEAFAK